MAFVDEIIIRAKAGKGGDGVVRWLHEYAREFGGPSGGDGGNGGNIIFRAVRDLQVLSSYRGRKSFKAEHGEAGSGKKMAGRNGEDFIIDVPVGALITRESTGQQFDLVEEGTEVVALKGGRGGLGNTRFKSSTNQYPESATPGREGGEDRFKIELRIIADIGLVGLPNAGKSSLLNAFSKAHAKVGSYAFTTLEPNLGVFHGHVIADIPGLIEGAAEGKGLGIKFLRHVARTKLLVHCIPADSEDPIKDYETVRAEIANYSESLSKKPEIVFITKADLVTPEALKALQELFEKRDRVAVPISIIDDTLIKEAGDSLIRFLRTEVIASPPTQS